MAPKKLRCIQRSIDRHWVGDGFPVRTLFAYSNLGPVLSPFLLLDYAGPMEFAPTTERRGDRYWPPVRRIDGAHGDRHLVCSCPPLEDYAGGA